MLTPVSNAIDAEVAAMEADGLAHASMSINNEKLRQLIKNYKSSPGWNSGMADAWQVNTSLHAVRHEHARSVDYRDHRGQSGGASRQEPGFDSVSIDMRVAGTAQWTTIAVKLSRFSVIDNTAPPTPGKPEKREYRARGYVGDQEMGQASEIVTATYPG